MQKWEYLFFFGHLDSDHARAVDIINRKPILTNVRPAEFQDYLKKLGSEGWELVAIRDGMYYFKRPIE